MKKTIRKRMLAITAAAASSFLLLSGFDSALTAQDVLEKAEEAAAQTGSVNAQVQGNADLSIDVTQSGATSSIPASGSIDLTVQMTEAPLAMYVGGTVTGDASALGMSANINVQTYFIANDDGTGTAYIYTEGVDDENTGWQAASVSADDVQKIADLISKAKTGDVTAAAAEAGIDVTALQEEIFSDSSLASGAVNVNGTDCYEVTSAITGDQIYSIVSQIAAANEDLGLDSSTLSIVQMLVSPLRIDITEDYSVDTFQPVYAKLDMSGSDFSLIGQLIGSMMFSSDSSDSVEEQPSISLTVNALNMTGTYDQTVPTIEVPAEAQAAPVSETELDVEDALSAIS